MLKAFLLNSLIKDLKVLKRLSGKVNPDDLDFRPKEGLRSTKELLQYLSYASTAILQYWLKNPDNKDFKSFYGEITAHARTLNSTDYPAVFESQVKTIHELFSEISEHDLFNKEVLHPSGITFFLGEGIIETSVKWLAAYKMQLFLYLKLKTDLQLSTSDLWRKFED